jgi:1,4-dihydroxy-2-naphthoyl-CoA synthase
MTYETIIVEGKGGIGFLTLNRPKVFNAISEQMIRELKKAVEELNQDPMVGVVIITGAGKGFQSGADIQELSRMSPLEILRWNQGVVENLEALEKMRQPVIAAINGYALGGGLELALTCTLRVAAKSAKMGVPEVKIGIPPGAGGTQRLPRFIGKGLAAEIFLPVNRSMPGKLSTSAWSTGSFPTTSLWPQPKRAPGKFWRMLALRRLWPRMSSKSGRISPWTGPFSMGRKIASHVLRPRI